MSSNILIYLDSVLSAIVTAIAIIFRLRSKVFSILKIKQNARGVLVIKFLGAGNFVAMSAELKHHNYSVISVAVNVNRS
jgi:hypothetical protein